MGQFDALYARLPRWGQHLAVTTYGVYWRQLRRGGNYRKYITEYEGRDRWNSAEWETWVSQTKRDILTAAADHVPYYRDNWTDAQKKAARAGEIADLPLLEKAPIRANPRAFVRTDGRRQRDYSFYTSGSTGTPIASIWITDEIRRSIAVREARSARWAGVSFQQPRATFSGRIVEPDPHSSGPFYRFNLAERQAYFSAFHLRSDTAAKYVHALQRHNIRWLTGYAVSSYLLARFMLQNGLTTPSVNAIITTSEKVTPEMRPIMEQAFGCRVFEEYSTVENVLFASECEHGSLHVSPDIGLVEILRPDGTACDPGEAGEVVVTSLMRAYQPLVRFRLGDLAKWSAEPCACGRAMPVLEEVVGRIEDVVVGPDGREMVRFHGVFIGQPHIVEGQVIQEAIDHIRVKVLPTDGFSSADEQDVISRVQQRLGAEVRVTVETVTQIERTKAGKFKAVISKLKHTGHQL